MDSLKIDLTSLDDAPPVDGLVNRLCEAPLDDTRSMIDLLGSVLQLPSRRSDLLALSCICRRMRRSMAPHLLDALECDAADLTASFGLEPGTICTLERLIVGSMALSDAKLLGAHLREGGAAPCVERVIVDPNADFPNLRKLKLGPLSKLRATFPGREFGDEHAIIIAQVAIKNSIGGRRALRELWLGTNRIGDLGAAAIGAALCSSSLLRLDLTCNLIGDQGARDLAASGVAANRSLR